jgi:hypothetical protein
VLGEDPRVAVERGEALLHARAAGLDEADHRDAGLPGEALDAHDRVGVLGAERAARVRRVLGEAEDGTPADAQRAADDTVAGAGLLAHPLGRDLGADDVQRAFVGEQPQPVERAHGRLLCTREDTAVRDDVCVADAIQIKGAAFSHVRVLCRGSSGVDEPPQRAPSRTGDTDVSGGGGGTPFAI